MSRFGCRVDAEAPWPMPQSDTVIPGQLALPSTASTEPEPAAPPAAAAPAPADAKPKSVDEALIKALDAQAPCGSHVDPMWIQVQCVALDALGCGSLNCETHVGTLRTIYTVYIYKYIYDMIYCRMDDPLNFLAANPVISSCQTIQLAIAFTVVKIQSCLESCLQ